MAANCSSPAEAAGSIRAQIPANGLFFGHEWRISPAPFALGSKLANELEKLGRILLQFNRAVNLLYRQSVEGKQPGWVAQWLDQGKPADLIRLQRAAAFKNDVPRVIRPDILLTESGFSITELDSVPGGIGLTAWMNEVYGAVGAAVIGGGDQMKSGFASIFGEAEQVHIIVSDEAATYRPEMEWLAERVQG